jgi:hypothetical protein
VPLRASWSSASFLLYAGGLVILLATGGLLTSLAGDYGDPAFLGWSVLVFVFLLDLAVAARFVGRPRTAGLFAVSAVIALAAVVGAFEEWAGWLAHTDSPFEGFHVSHFLIELTLLVGAMAARRFFRFPLLSLIATGSAWFFVTDVLSGGGNWSATVTLVFGLAAMMVGVTADSVYGFWVHVVAGLTIGGALLWFSHSSNTDWILIGLASLLYVWIASGLGRSSYAVLGAFGLLLATTHFVNEWFAAPFVPFFGGFFGSSESGRAGGAGLVLAGDRRGRGMTEPA